MKLLSVEIKNFRSLKDVKVAGPKDDVWTLIGQNNAGKSCVIHALRAFYGDYNVTNEDFFRGCGADSSIEITLEFCLSEEEFSQLPEFYKLPDNKLKVIKRFSRDNLKGKPHGFENRDGIITEREEDFFGAKNVQIGKLGNIIYVPAVKGLSDELKQVKSSIFTKLLTRIISDTLESLPSWTELVKNTKSFAQDLRSPVKNSGNLNSINEIEEDLTKKLSSWNLRTKITLLPPTPEDIVLTGSQLRFISDETNQEEDPMFLGSGAQRAIVNNLLLLWAEIEGKRVIYASICSN
jgi:predicted ATP-dependent endonuclease of OLD family